MLLQVKRICFAFSCFLHFKTWAMFTYYDKPGILPTLWATHINRCIVLVRMKNVKCDVYVNCATVRLTSQTPLPSLSTAAHTPCLVLCSSEFDSRSLFFFPQTGDDNSIPIGEWMKADRWRDTNRKPRRCPVCQILWYMSKLWRDWDKKKKKEKKQDPIYFTPLLAFHFCDWRQRAYQLQNY